MHPLIRQTERGLALDAYLSLHTSSAHRFLVALCIVSQNQLVQFNNWLLPFVFVFFYMSHTNSIHPSYLFHWHQVSLILTTECQSQISLSLAANPHTVFVFFYFCISNGPKFRSPASALFVYWDHLNRRQQVWEIKIMIWFSFWLRFKLYRLWRAWLSGDLIMWQAAWFKAVCVNTGKLWLLCMHFNI